MNFREKRDVTAKAELRMFKHEIVDGFLASKK